MQFSTFDLVYFQPAEICDKPILVKVILWFDLLSWLAASDNHPVVMHMHAKFASKTGSP